MLGGGRDRVLCEARKPLKQFRAMLCGPSGPEALEAFKRFLRKEKNPWSRWRIWKTIKLGDIKSTKELRKAIIAAGMGFMDEAKELLDDSRFTVAERETEVDLVVASGFELGFNNLNDAPITSCSEIYARAKTLGLELCPAEVGPQLRLQYKDQPRDETLTIAMGEFYDVIHDNCKTFYVSGYYNALGQTSGGSYGFRDVRVKWVFVLPRK